MKFFGYKSHLLFFTWWLFYMLPSVAQETDTAAVLVAGGGTGGIAAAIQSARLGVHTLLVEQTNCLGGMLTAAGVSCTDGNNLLQSGIWEEFRQALYQHYKTHDLATGWVSETCFEPHAGDSIFKAFAAKEKNLTVLYGWYFDKTLVKGNRVTGAVFSNKKGKKLIIHALITIDATELGDVFAGAGADYDLGTEDAAYAKEKMAPGKTTIIQDITWTAILSLGNTSQPGIARPVDYNPKNYYCSCSSAPCKEKAYPADAKKMLEYGKLPNNKYMINWPAHGNDYYINLVEEKPLEREQHYQKIKDHTLGFLYFIQHELGFKNAGLATDELDSGMAYIPYNREGRRVKGIVRFNINAILDPYAQADKLYRTGISVGDYPVDHHHGQNPQTPTIHFPSIPSFNIPLGALIPQKTDGLVVCEKGISVSNIVNGSTRLQPVVLLTGQAAGALAALSVQHNRQPREVSVRQVQQVLLDSGCYLMPYADVKRSDSYWKAVQRIGCTGILRGFGKPEGWENKTLFYPDTTITIAAFEKGIHAFDPSYHPMSSTGQLLTIKKAIEIISGHRKLFHASITGDHFYRGSWEHRLGLVNFNPGRNIRKYELAVLLDHYTSVFSRPVSFEGK